MAATAWAAEMAASAAAMAAKAARGELLVKEAGTVAKPEQGATAVRGWREEVSSAAATTEQESQPDL